ncbi:MAG: response regulator, partial [Longimonas sp.]|uniref:ATP-binding protein n=1 Tax=Longimonas sp. TaxID=2039626 RepID=UPI003347FBE7
MPLCATAQTVSSSHWAHPEAGMPLVEQYAADDYGASSQNWTATQDSTHTLYVANTDGVLTFDGARWELFPVPNRSIVRGLATSADGRVYVGAQDEMGYMERTEGGLLRYVSLRNKVDAGPDDLGDIWEVVTLGPDAFFHTYEGVYRWSADAQRMHRLSLPDESDLFPLVVVQDTAYVASGRQLFRIDQKELLPVAGFETPLLPDGSQDAIRDVAPYNGDQMLVGTLASRFFLWDGERLEPFAVSFADKLDDVIIYDINRLSDGSFAISTIENGLFISDSEGQLIRHWPFPDQPTLGTYEDHEGGVWVVLDSGIRRIDWGTPLSTYPNEYANETVTGVTRHDGTITISTNSGVGTVEPPAQPGDVARIQKHAPFTQIWALHPHNGTLLIGTSQTVAQWQRDDNVVADLGLNSFHAFRISSHPQDPNELFVSTTRGLERFSYDPATASWSSRPTLRDDIGNFSRQAWANDSTLWVGTRYAGLMRFTIDADGHVQEERLFTSDDGHIMPFRFDDTMFFYSPEHTSQFSEEDERFMPLDDIPFVASDLASTSVLLAEDGTGRWWGNTNAGFGWWARDADQNWSWQSRSLQRISRHIIRAVHAEDDVVWLATDRGLLRYVPEQDNPPSVSGLIQSVSSLPADSTLWGMTQTDASSPRKVAHDHNSIRIRYAAPSYTLPASTEYRVRLRGLSDAWSAWTTSAQRDFTNLSPGSYTFEMQARTVRGQRAETALMTFTVAPPWYLTWWAYVLYGFAAVALVVGSVRWRTMALRHRQRQLESIINDRTVEVRQKNEQLAEQAEALRSLDAAKSRFFANISHELRTPLTLILGPIEQLLRRSMPDDPAQQTLSMVERNAQRLLNLVQQLLHLSELEAGTFTIQARPCELGAKMKQVAKGFERLAQSNGLKLSVQHTPPPIEAKTAYADAEHIEQVVSNLLTNAIKFTPDGGTINVEIQETATETLLSVQDTGIGIAEDDQRAIFERFRQVDASSTRAREGAGIGLALARDLVEAHGGTIAVESALGEGTTFTVILPRGKDALPEPPSTDGSAEDSADNEVLRSTKAGISGDGAPGNGSSGDGADGEVHVPATPPPALASAAPSSSGDSMQATDPPTPSTAPLILVADDNPDMRAYVRSILEEDFRIMEAADGEEGVQKAKRHLPDIILADVMMPGTDGIDMAQALRDDPDTEAIPIIMVTARSDTRAELRGLSAGARDYITKPFDPDVLEMRIRGVLDWMHRLRRRLQRKSMAAASLEAPSTPGSVSGDDADASSSPPENDSEEGSPQNEAPAPESEAKRSEFEQNVRAIIESNITDIDFDVDDLAEEMMMSRSTLYRRARTNKAPSPASL